MYMFEGFLLIYIACMSFLWLPSLFSAVVSVFNVLPSSFTLYIYTLIKLLNDQLEHLVGITGMAPKYLASFLSLSCLLICQVSPHPLLFTLLFPKNVMFSGHTSIGSHN